MRDEFSFKSIKLRSISEFPDEVNDDKTPLSSFPSQQSEFSLEQPSELEKSLSHLKMETTMTENNDNNKTENNIKNSEFEKKESKESKVKKNVYEYFAKNKILKKDDFDSFLSYIGLREIWSTKDEQDILWDAIAANAKDKNNIKYEDVLAGICNLFEESDESKEKNENLEVFGEINENCIDEYLQKIKDNDKLLFDIKFINEIFLNDNEIKINLDNVMDEIKKKYRFIKINSSDLETYFKNLSNNNISSSDTFELNNELVNYVKTMIKIKYNNNNISINNNANTVNIRRSNINISKDKIISELDKIDNIISDIFKTMVTFSNNKDLLELFQYYYDNIIINEKKNIYNDLLNNNTNNIIKHKKSGSLPDNNLNFQKNNKILLFPNDENDYLKQQIQNLKERNDYLQKKITELTSNSRSKSNKKLIKVKTAKTKLTNLANINHNNSIINKAQLRNSSVAGDENFLMKNIINYNIMKNFSNTSNNSSNNNLINISDYNNRFSDDNNESNNNISNKMFSNTRSNVTNDLSNEDLTNSRVDLFSINANNTMNGRFMLDSSNLGNTSNNFSSNDSGHYTPTLSPKDDSLFDKFSPINDKTIEQEYNNINVIKIKKNYNQAVIEKKNSTYRYYNMINNKMTFGINNNLISINNINNNNVNMNSININNSNNSSSLNNTNDSLSILASNCFYDFEFLSCKKKIEILLMHNNEKLKPKEIYSDNINYMLNNTKKKSGTLLITSQCLYILTGADNENDEESQVNVSLRISHKLLESITVTNKFFNLLLLKFKEGTYIIIETFRRIYLLNFLRNVFTLYKYKKFIVFYNNCFDIPINNKKIEKYEIKKSKNFFVTPNFETAIKFGFLVKYKENFFSGSFNSRFVVLSDVGLIIFTKYPDIFPKAIIPVVGSIVKYVPMQDYNLYCFRIRTPDDRAYIFGSKNKKEILNWIDELVKYKQEYKRKMKIVTDDFKCK